MRVSRVFAVLVMSATLVMAAVPANGALTDGLQQAVAGAEELSAPKPAWYTAQLHAKVVEAGDRGEGVPLPDGVTYPSSGLAFTGIRPGAWMIAPAGCTMNFVFGQAPNYYIGTAGHCTEPGDEVTIFAAPGLLMNIGKTVKSVDNGVGDDFALVEIRPEMAEHVNPSMTYFGGPTGQGSPESGDIVEHAGHGLVIGTGGTPRAGVVAYRGPGDERRSDAFSWAGAASPGDSGSPVRLADGTAAGDLTHLVVGEPYAPGAVAGTSIERMLKIAGKPLATAPDGPDPAS
ncbi:hypothetical protein [Streptomyces sp. KR80]|uniref:hypothetical protein n=1 Tax=Streptomyces sp. KR80 TaxID=3457426 RepID=UPI003FD64336